MAYQPTTGFGGGGGLSPNVDLSQLLYEADNNEGHGNVNRTHLDNDCNY